MELAFKSQPEHHILPRVSDIDINICNYRKRSTQFSQQGIKGTVVQIRWASLPGRCKQKGRESALDFENSYIARGKRHQGISPHCKQPTPSFFWMNSCHADRWPCLSSLNCLPASWKHCYKVRSFLGVIVTNARVLGLCACYLTNYLLRVYKIDYVHLGWMICVTNSSYTPGFHNALTMYSQNSERQNELGRVRVKTRSRLHSNWYGLQAKVNDRQMKRQAAQANV